MNTTKSPSSIVVNHMRVSVSYHCNLRCEHCYVPEDYRVNYNKLLKSDELSIEQITEFLSYLHANHGLEKISVTGGEPLLRNVWPRSKAVIEFAAANKLKVQLNTGGLGQIPVKDVIAPFENKRDLMFQISLDGSNRNTVDRFRGRKGVFESAFKYMEDAISLGARVQVRYTANASNLDEAYEAYRLVSDVPVTFFKIKPMFAAGTAIDNADKLLMSESMIESLQERLIEMSDSLSTLLELPPPVFVNVEKYKDFKNFRTVSCTCGRESGYLSTNGDLLPCSYTIGDCNNGDFKVGNIVDPDFSFVDAWMSAGMLDKYKKDNGIQTCPSQVTLLRNVSCSA